MIVHSATIGDLYAFICDNISNQERINIFKKAIHLVSTQKTGGYCAIVQAIRELIPTFCYVKDAEIPEFWLYQALSANKYHIETKLFPEYNMTTVEKWLISEERSTDRMRVLQFNSTRDCLDFMKYYLDTYLISE